MKGNHQMKRYTLFMSAKEIKIIEACDIYDALLQVPEMNASTIFFGQVDFATQWVENTPYELLEITE